MRNDTKIKSLQRLGIDIWVPRAKSRARSPKKEHVQADIQTQREAKLEELQTTAQSPDQQPETDAALSEVKPVELSYEADAIHLDFYHGGNALIAVGRGAEAPRLMIKGILTALTGNAVDEPRSIKFDFPPGGGTSHRYESESHFFQQAVKAVHVALVHEVPTSFVLTVGPMARSIGEQLPAGKIKTICIDEIPMTANDKKALWDKVKSVR